MPKITVELVAVDHMLWSGEAESLVAETTEGEIGILPGHEPLLGQLVDNGIVVIRPVEGEPKVAAVQGGFLSVSQEKTTVLADFAVWADEVDEAKAEEDLSSDDELTQARATAGLKALRRAASVGAR
ncbi:F0F1 ATP synthase subunit epsilon [Corynebacterium otitidis]|uniref:F0F1 ATP synthase subunit epsilon n=1 Tax=Corynebacterium otitidis TaxID=29321 RepID=UPI000627A1D8|nr:F0F1 ATP synthase subunit epsilon [Corynebacterium otitidis]KKO84404.1 ATP synthase F0F1 subunit epsilon [Corynebacterium otitidis]